MITSYVKGRNETLEVNTKFIHEMSKLIVTGAAGFIGSSLSERLLQVGHEVIGVDQINDYYNQNFKRKNIESLNTFEKFTLVEDDIQALDW